MNIIPAILETDAEAAREKLAKYASLAPEFQIDVLDGSLFSRSSWSDPYELGLPEEKLPFIELHLMTLAPAKHIVAWHTAYPKKLKRVIFHGELNGELEHHITLAKELGLEIGIALSPGAELDVLQQYADQLERVLVLGVEPGASGQPFLGAPILDRIRNLRARSLDLTIAVDGGVNIETANDIIAAGANTLCAASSIWTDTPKESLKKLTDAALADDA